MAISQDRGYYSQLTSKNVYDYHGESVLHCLSNRVLTAVTSSSCELALFFDRKEDIKSFCDFRFIPNHIKLLISSLTLKLVTTDDF